MIKTLIKFSLIFLFSSSLIAEEITMYCSQNKYFYKYVTSADGDFVLHNNEKRDGKGVYSTFCPATVNNENSHWLVSIKGHSSITKDYKTVCILEEAIIKNGASTVSFTNNTSVMDFTKFTRETEYYFNGSKKKTKAAYKCKKIK